MTTQNTLDLIIVNSYRIMRIAHTCRTNESHILIVL